MKNKKEKHSSLPPFFSVGDYSNYMKRGDGTFTHVWLGNIEVSTSIDIRHNVIWDKGFLYTEITMEEFYSKLNEAFNILSIGSHELKEAADNNFSQAAHEDLLQAHGHESAEFSC